MAYDPNELKKIEHEIKNCPDCDNKNVCARHSYAEIMRRCHEAGVNRRK
jgi:transposase